MLWHFFCLDRKYLIYNLVRRNLKQKYRNSWLGILWTMVPPAFSALIFHFIFSQIMKVKMDDYLTYVILGIVPWGVLTICLQAGLESIPVNTNLINKVPLPVQSLPFAESVYGFINLIAAIPVIVVVALIDGVSFSPFWFLLLPLWGAFFIICYGLALMMGLLIVYFKDLRHILALTLQVWFYATPVLYSRDMVPAEYAWIIQLNPVGGLFVAFRDVTLYHRWPGSEELLQISVWTLLILTVSFLLWKKLRHRIAEDL